MQRVRKARLLLVVAVAATGLACLGEAAWIHVKARLAQVLIAAAWERSRHSESNLRPWAWADTQPVARLNVLGKHARELMVLEGTSGRNLAFGPTHDPASVLPGERGNSVIAGHRDTHFRFLKDLRAGDRLQTKLANGKSQQFAVTDARVVDSRYVRIELDAAVPRLTLVTCYPFDAIQPGGPLRFVVTADWIADTRN